LALGPGKQDAERLNRQLVDTNLELQAAKEQLAAANEELRREKTERQRAGESLREGERRYRSLFEGMLHGFAHCEMVVENGEPRDFVYLEVNKAFEELTGLTGVVGRNASEVIPGIRESSPELFERYGRVASTGIPERFDFYLPALDIWFSISVFSPENGHFIALFDNISERRRTEEALRFQNLLLATLSEVSIDGILVVDSRARIIHVNRRFVEMWGIPPHLATAGDDEPVLQTVVGKVSAPDEFLARVRHLYEHPEETGHEEIALRDGRTFERYSAPMLGAEHDYYGRVWYFRDVSRRKREQETLAKRELHFRSLIENAQDIITIIDLEGKIGFQSPAVKRILGRLPEEFVGRSAFDFLHPDDAAEFRAAIGRVIERPEAPQTSLFRFRHANGSWRTMEGIGKLLPGEGPSQIVVNSRDVTESHALEQQLRQSQKMEAVGQLAGGIAHDFNNLLTAILGYSDVLASRTGDDALARQDIDEIRRAGERAASLTRQLLAFSRKQILEPRVLDLNGVVRNIEQMLRRLIGEDVELETRLPDSVGAVRADPGQIEQVIMNLIVNARDAMPTGGKLTIATADVELDASVAAFQFDVPPGRYVLLAVSDTGHGMDARTLSHIFEPFFTTKEQGKGTGLGLSTVYGIVKQSGGHIAAYSELGEGTSVKVYLPCVGAPSGQTVTPAAEESPARGSETILLVEDEQAVRRLVRAVLESSGFRLLEAPSGEAALQIARNHDGPIHLVLTDVVMPGMRGPEFAKRLVESHPETRALFISGYTDDAVMQHGLGPETFFLQKPFTPRALLQKVREALGAPPA
jgi:two-component system cell cycle sensor histidine kinase/response regulator CckA